MRETTNKESRTMNIQTETINGTTYYSTIVRGVKYAINYNEITQDWTLNSNRHYTLRGIHRQPGTFRYFKTLEQIESKIKSLFGISALIQGFGA